MRNAEDVIRVWCDRLDSWFSSGASVSKLSEAQCRSSSEDSASAMRGCRRVKAVDAVVRSAATGHFQIELDNAGTSEILQSASSFKVLVSSRWGNDPLRHWEFGHFLMQSARQAYQQGIVLLVADGSAVEPWAQHASKLTGATLLRVGFGKPVQQTRPQVQVRFSDGLDITRDSGIIAMADRIDAVHVRRSGRIETLLKRWINSVMRCSPAERFLRVGHTGGSTSAASNLIKAGAVGWSVAGASNNRNAESHTAESEPKFSFTANTDGRCSKRVLVASNALGLCTTRDWLNEPGQWLVHCTRARTGPWPDETLPEYRDAILTLDRGIAKRTALDSLCRIILSGQILSSAIVSARQYPVVCWSAVPLLQLLKQRCFRSHVQRWDYEPYGVAIRGKAMHRLGGRPVIYGQPDEAGKLPRRERFRFQACGKTINWRNEQEWRLAGDLSLTAVNPGDVRIFALDSSSARMKLAHLPWKVTMLRHVSKRTLKKIGNDGLSEIWKAV